MDPHSSYTDHMIGNLVSPNLFEEASESEVDVDFTDDESLQQEQPVESMNGYDKTHIEDTDDDVPSSYTASTRNKDIDDDIESEYAVDGRSDRQVADTTMEEGLPVKTKDKREKAPSSTKDKPTPVSDDDVNARRRKKRYFMIGTVLLLAVVAAVVAAIVSAGGGGGSANGSAPPKTDREEDLNGIFKLISDPALLNTMGTPQNLARSWIANSDPLQLSRYSSTDARIAQRYILAVFWYSTGGQTSWLNNDWLLGTDECAGNFWFGLSCNEGGKVRAISFGKWISSSCVLCL